MTVTSAWPVKMFEACKTIPQPSLCQFSGKPRRHTQSINSSWYCRGHRLQAGQANLAHRSCREGLVDVDITGWRCCPSALLPRG